MFKIYLLILLINKINSDLTSLPPCCRDMLGALTCARMLRNNKKVFVDKCNSNIEFRILQCCSTCTKDEDSLPYDFIVPKLIQESSCKDRYSKEYCDKFIKKSKDNYIESYCSENNLAVTFRTCRKSCGYCGDNSSIEYKYDKAMETCYNQKLYNINYKNRKMKRNLKRDV
uniref:ShKT domain-containing protein n=1 Tax=Strongyloides venezuelensis TaxID=75913 RepID=A0A0K0F334_STRVS